MRKRIARVTAVLLVVMAAAAVAWGQDEKLGGENRWQGQHPAGMHGPHQFAAQGQHGFGGGGGSEGFGGHRMMMGGRGGHGFGGGRGLLRMADNPRVRAYLNLTDQQVTSLHQISVESEKASIRTRADLELRGIELHELMRADNPDHDAVMRKVQEVSDLRGQMVKQRMETMFTARNVLTPEQIKKAKTFMESGGRGGSGGPGGPGGERSMERRGGTGRRPGGPATPGAPSAPPAHPSNPPATQ